ncbi:hypothetical protein QVG61_07350 [Thiohalobacter sp. IOR34]|uniref:hypothetical protein n=1 Tax=Thiohalobacter sp. IOR34 TaxID=3057176 RepID=UPI0025B05B63|nr:hypothetical protein [Thiohalobacter sp. IOR34]WJW74336.1 hypothetical protein QVG61_07350 [Thiohalobacter sp. IOR34]
MILNVYVNDQTHPVEVPDGLLDEAEEFFTRMDRDMDRGYQMSRRWVENPDPVQRCQIAADKLLTALECGNSNLSVMMAGYILKRMPGVRGVHMDLEGNMLEHGFEVAGQP